MDQKMDLVLQGGHVEALVEPSDTPVGDADEVVDASGCVVAPGFIDVHVHLRDPGQTEKEDIRSGSQAAVAGGFTTVLCMPNTVPVNDSVEVTRLILEKVRKEAACKVLPIGAVTLGQRGKELAPLRELKEAGCVAFSDDGCPVNDAQVMREALIMAKQLNSVIIEHCEENSFLPRPTIHNGEVAAKMGLEGVPRSSETIDVARSLMLAVELDAPLHLAHLSCEESVQLLAAFKHRASKITAEVTPHHLFLTQDAIRTHGTNAKMNPPLRLESDCQAVVQGLIQGWIDVVASDHAPHAAKEKDLPFEKAPNGIVGLETAFSLLMRLVKKGSMDLTQLIDVMSCKPARIMGIEGGSLKKGSPADVVIFDPAPETNFEKEKTKSKSSNSPFWGASGWGEIRSTWVDGKRVYSNFGKKV